MGSQTAPKEGHRRALQVLELVLELDPALRRAYLENLGRRAPDLRQQVVALVRALEGSPPPDGDATAAEGRLASLAMPQRVGPYQVLHELGRGGMSRVYLAERADAEFERRVALKVIDQGLEAPLVQQRFLAERQILASFDCPQIAKLYDGGTLPNGRPYLVMELVDGVRADQYCAERRLGLHERLQLFRQICGAVSYAHRQLVVHRDLKPSNILVRPDGEVKLLDFGIAKLLDPQSFPLPLAEHTISHYRPMTPSYASPEQLLGEPISTATDIYALGVLLFQLTTGAVPHPGRDRLQQALRERAGAETPPKPSESLEGEAAARAWAGHDRRRVARQLRGDLDNIVAKALRPKPEDRYGSVAELDEDLRRYLAGEPVRATRETPLYLFGKFVGRYRLGFAAAAIFLGLFLAFTLVTQRQSLRIAAERDRADEIRGFLAGLIGSADSQSRRSGGALSLKELLDENLERLKRLPFQEPQTQCELLELIGNAYQALELSHNAAECYRLALRQRGRPEADRTRLLLELGEAAGEAGAAGESLAALNEALFLISRDDPASLLRAYVQFVESQQLQGDLATAATNLRLALQLLEPRPDFGGGSPLALLLEKRLALALAIGAGRETLAAASDDLLAALGRARRHGLGAAAPWTALGGAYAVLGDPAQALESHRLVFELTRDDHGYGLPRTHASELLAAWLLRQGRAEEALRAVEVAARSAGELLDLEPQSPRSRWQLGQVETRQAEILLALGRPDDARKALVEAIARLQPLAEEGVAVAQEALARAYLLAELRGEARPLVAALLEKGWRRADFLALAASKGTLPEPPPQPLELDLALPGKVRAYLDALPAESPPWRSGAALPSVEEMLAAGAAR